MKWKPEEEKLTDFVFRFSQLVHEISYTDEQQISHFVLCFPRGLYLYLEGAKTVPDAVENLRKGIALGGLDTFNFASDTPCETNLDGLVLGCRQPSKSDQASDLEEKACLHVAIQVPEPNETHLCEGKQKTKNDVEYCPT